MNVYTLRADVNRYRRLLDREEDDLLEFSLSFNGTPLAASRKSKKRRFEFYSALGLVGDCPGLCTHIPVFNTKAVKALKDLLKGNGELLHMSCEGQDYYLFNVTRVIDALDEDHSKLIRFDSGRIMDVDRYSFSPQVLRGAIIFKIPHAVLMDVFVTDDFVQRVKEFGLKGFDFRLVWSDQDPY